MSSNQAAVIIQHVRLGKDVEQSDADCDKDGRRVSCDLSAPSVWRSLRGTNESLSEPVYFNVRRRYETSARACPLKCKMMTC